jgi:glucose/arabinose dehydrogenase
VVNTATRRAIATITVLFLFSMLVAACSGPERLSDDEVTPDPGGEQQTPTQVVQEPGSTQEPSPAVTDPEVTSEPDVSDPTETASESPQPEATTPPGQDDPTTTPETPDAGTPTQQPSDDPDVRQFDPDAVRVSYEEVGSGFEQPVLVTHSNDGSGTVYVLEKVGTVRRLDGTMVLDIRDQVVQTGVFGYEHEQGMLGLAFHPDFARNGYFYVHYNAVDGSHVYSRFTMNANGTADRASETVFLTYPQPEVNFQGGMLLFGDDGYLYAGTGTGGSEVALQFLAQDLDSIYGKILRIDVNSGDPYGIPPDNPFVGVDGALDEIWAFGLRNPWRFSFDRATGDLFIGGPGQFTEEWVDYQPASEPSGQNFGWPMYEGTQCWESWDGPCDPAGLRMPILTYPTYENGNCVVIGGYVHRGTEQPLLNGAYFFGDFCSGNVWTGWNEGGVWQMEQVFQISGMVSSFGEDEAGELYVCDINNGLVYRITGSPR